MTSGCNVSPGDTETSVFLGCGGRGKTMHKKKACHLAKANTLVWNRTSSAINLNTGKGRDPRGHRCRTVHAGCCRMQACFHQIGASQSDSCRLVGDKMRTSERPLRTISAKLNRRATRETRWARRFCLPTSCGSWLKSERSNERAHLLSLEAKSPLSALAVHPYGSHGLAGQYRTIRFVRCRLMQSSSAKPVLA